MKSNIAFNLTYLSVTDLAKASSAPLKTQVKAALEGPFGQRKNMNCSLVGKLAKRRENDKKNV